MECRTGGLCDPKEIMHLVLAHSQVVRTSHVDPLLCGMTETLPQTLWHDSTDRFYSICLFKPMSFPRFWSMSHRTPCYSMFALTKDTTCISQSAQLLLAHKGSQLNFLLLHRIAPVRSLFETPQPEVHALLWCFGALPAASRGKRSSFRLLTQCGE